MWLALLTASKEAWRQISCNKKFGNLSRMIQVKKSAQDLLQNFKTTRSPSLSESIPGESEQIKAFRAIMPALSAGKKGSKPTCAWIWEKFEICSTKWEALLRVRASLPLRLTMQTCRTIKICSQTGLAVRKTFDEYWVLELQRKMHSFFFPPGWCFPSGK